MIPNSRGNWRHLARLLTKLSNQEGKAEFYSEAFNLINEFVEIESCSVFKVTSDKTSRAQHLHTFGNLDAELSENLAKDYVENGFKNDPMVQTAIPSGNVRVRHLAVSNYSSSYRSTYFDIAKLTDKITSIFTTNFVIFLVNFYRGEKQGPLSSQDLKDLEILAPIFGRFLLRNAHMSSPQLNHGSFDQIVEDTLSDDIQIFSTLSPREKEICRHLLLNNKIEMIAKQLEIAPNTVITHKRRLYTKLNVNNLAELFQLFTVSSYRR